MYVDFCWVCHSVGAVRFLGSVVSIEFIEFVGFLEFGVLLRIILPKSYSDARKLISIHYFAILRACSKTFALAYRILSI